MKVVVGVKLKGAKHSGEDSCGTVFVWELGLGAAFEASFFEQLRNRLPERQNTPNAKKRATETGGEG